MRGRNDVVAAVQTTLQAWLPSYLIQAARDYGWPADPCDVPRPRTWRRVLTADELPPDSQLPSVAVSSSGWVIEPERHGETVDAVYEIMIVATVRGPKRDWTQTGDFSGLYATAIAALLDQQTDLGTDDWAETRVVSGAFVPLGEDNQRTLAEVHVTAHVAVTSIHDLFRTSSVPPADPCAAPQTGPEVESVTVGVTHEGGSMYGPVYPDDF